MTPHILTIDAGTTSVKVCLFSPDLKLKKKSIQEYSLQKNGLQVEAEAGTYLEAVRRGVLETGAGAEDIAAVGLTTQGETLTLTDRSGVPLRPFLVWLDQRAEKEAEILKERFPDEMFYRETGLPGITGAMPLAKALWLKKNEPDLFSRAGRLVLLEDYLLHFMTGRFLTERTLQTSTGWYSLRKDRFWSEALDAAGISCDMLPELTDSGSFAGPLAKTAADALGIRPGVPVCTGAMDQISAAWAMNSLFPCPVMETTGTALVAAATVTGLSILDRKDLLRTTLYRYVTGNRYLLLPIGNTGGMSLTWFRDQFCRDLDGSYDSLSRLAQNAPPGAGGLLFLPFLDGSVDPDFCPQAKAVFFGLSLSSERSHCVRAVMEGVAHLLREMLEIMEKCGIPAEQVCSLGGGGRSPVWEQIKADVCGKPFLTLDCEEAPSLGAALLAGQGAGILSGNPSSCLCVTARYDPDPSTSEIYRKSHETYQKLYQAVRPLF